MKRIPLSNSESMALVDDDVFELLSELTWCLTDNGYARATVRISSRPHLNKNLYMHRVIMGSPDCDVDHRDTNKLNNQSSNLRVCARAQNKFNAPAKKTNKIGLKGVKRSHTKSERWHARIVAWGKGYYLGTFPTPILAARAYNEAALKLHGEFARLNPV